MWKPSAYPDHNESLERWLSKFNTAVPLDITAKTHETELFVYDGTINLWGVIVNFDWEKRQDWKGANFPFQEVGQFERKFQEQKQIELALMCNSDETHILCAWHSDFKDRILVSRETEQPTKEQGYMRLSNKFKIYSYQELRILKM